MNESSSITRPYWIHALTPLHVGAGTGIGFIDLPIMREAVTKWPLVPGSAVKGVLRDHHAGTDARMLKLAFGHADTQESNAGSLVFTDARIICLPVRSLFGTFAWCTSPLVLQRLHRDLDVPSPGNPVVANAAAILVPNDPASVLADAEGRAFFEDLDFTVNRDLVAAAWAAAIADFAFGPDDGWNALFRQRFAVVHDDVFNFLSDTATQVDARVRIEGDTKTVAEGALWYEESLPAETLLAGLVWCGPIYEKDRRNDAALRAELLDEYCSGSVQLQIGGKATVGRGQARVVFS